MTAIQFLKKSLPYFLIFSHPLHHLLSILFLQPIPTRQSMFSTQNQPIQCNSLHFKKISPNKINFEIQCQFDIMEIVKSVKISFSLDDIAQHMNEMTREQIVDKFRLVLYHKENQINEKIQKLNAEHLLILQKKVLIVEKKDEQIFKLNNTITAYKNQLNDEKTRVNQLVDELIETKSKFLYLEKKQSQCQNIYGEQKQVINNLKQEKKMLELQIENVKDQMSIQQRQIKKLKEEKTNWEENTELLLSNQKKVVEDQARKKIKSLTVEKDYKIHNLKEQIKQGEEKLKHQLFIYQDAKKTVHNWKKKVQALEKQLQFRQEKYRKTFKISKENKETQTEVEEQKKQIMSKKVEHIEKKQNEVQVNFECENCLLLKEEISLLESDLINFSKMEKKVSTHEPKQQKKQIMYYNDSCQTDLQVVKIIEKAVKESQTRLICQDPEKQYDNIENMQNFIRIIQRRYQLLQNKYEELHLIFEDRPSRPEDIQQLGLLKKKIVELQILLLQEKNENDKLRTITQSLDCQIFSRDKILRTIPVQTKGDRIKNNREKEFNSIAVTRTIPFHSHKNSLKLMTITQCQTQDNELSFSCCHDRAEQDRAHQTINQALLEKGITFRRNDQIFRKSTSQEGQRSKFYKKYKSPNRSYYINTKRN